MYKYIILGIIQGLTEFLPVSSSAHLVVMQRILGLQEQAVLVSVVLHLGTTLALTIFFLKDILAAIRNFRDVSFIILTTLVTAVIGISGKRFFESLFNLPFVVALGLLFNAGLLILVNRFMQGKRHNLNLKDALVLGLSQGLAIVPGISRAGTTISTLLFRGLAREVSFRFAFIVSIPAVLGAVLLEAKDIQGIACTSLYCLLAGFIFSFISGLFALKILQGILLRAKLDYFGYYCMALAMVIFLFIK